MLYHLHIEKSGGKTIETNLGIAIGARCLRLTTVDGFSKVNKQPDQSKLAQAVNSTNATILTGHFAFGLHEMLGDKNPQYISLVRSPLSRARSYYNYILGSHMYDLKDLLLRNRWGFEDFALGAYADAGLPEEIGLVRSNGQSRAIGNALGADLNQEQIFARAVASIESVDYDIFPTEQSVEAYYWILRKLGCSPIRRYVLANITPYDHVGTIDPKVRKRFEEANEADQNLYELARERAAATLKQARSIKVYASIARRAVKLEQQAKLALGPRFVAAISETLRPARNAAGQAMTEFSLQLPQGIRQMNVMSGDVKGELYSRKNNWDDIPHRLWKEAVRRSGAVVDLGSNYGEFLLVAEEVVGSDCKVVSVEANPDVAACQAETLERTALAGRVQILNRAASSQSGQEVTFHVRSGDSGSSSVLPTHRSKKITVSTTTVDEVLGEAPINFLSIKIDIEGHDVQALKGAARSIEQSAASFITLELNAQQWPEFLAVLKQSGKLTSSPVFIYIWNSLFRVDRQFSPPPRYQGNFDVYVSNDPELTEVLESHASAFRYEGVA